MKKDNLIIGGITLLVIAIIAYYLIEKRKREDDLKESLDREKSISQENKVLKKMIDELKSEVNEIIDNKDELPREIKNQLKNLIEEYKDIDEKVTNELLSVTALIEIKEETKAILSLAKIIENLLKRIYKEDPELSSQTKGRHLNFSDYINHAHRNNILGKDEFHFLNGVREVRNEEAHEIGVRKERNILYTSMLIGVAIIIKLSTLLKGL